MAKIQLRMSIEQAQQVMEDSEILEQLKTQDEFSMLSSAAKAARKRIHKVASRAEQALRVDVA